MASALIVPGVQVKFEFEPAPVLPGATGILGVVGVTDFGPLTPTPVGSFSEFLDIFGPGSAFSMPEVRTAFINGVKEVVVARLAPGAGTKASLLLRDDEKDDIAILEARAEGTWGKDLSARIEQVRTLDGSGVKHVNLTLLRNGEVIETLSNLVMDETSPSYLFDQINFTSRAIVAYDPVLAKSLPEDVQQTDLAESDLRRAAAKLRSGGSDVLLIEAKKPGRPGNNLSVAVRDGRYGVEHAGLDISAKAAGSAGAAISFSVENNAGNETKLTVFGAGDPVIYTTTAGVDDLLQKAAVNPDVVIRKLRDAPLDAKAKTNLTRRVAIDVMADGKATVVYPDQSGPDLAKLDDIEKLKDPLVEFKKAENATNLPDNTGGVPLTGGRPIGQALALSNGGQDLLELQRRENIPQVAAGDKIAVELKRGKSSVDGTTPVVNLAVFLNGQPVESFADLTMDPDDPNYLPAALQGSRFLSAVDLFVRSKLTSMPSNSGRAQPFNGGTSPSVNDYQGALERLESAEEVDLVIASVAGQLSDPDIVAVHQLVQAHCTKMVGQVRNRIGLGSVARSASGAAAGTRVPAILSHADLVRSNDFVLTAPAGSEAAVAGLLSLQDYFQSPTFKNVAALGVPPGDYSDAELNRLVAGNVLVVNQKRRLGTIVIKGVLTGGRQINVQRTANKAVRDVKAIADVYIGLLNNEGNRNALRQQIIAMFLQMTRDGALVPSTDGKDPPFKVDVHSTQADFANGIVRVDIAIRPVRAIDYVYATILVQN
ncbi:hypothetical protein VW23_009515 [Devosia insulae DS-56]|uniref:Tail sheath protein C-terminal domain-containing protein n=1 Tax=Devosia insulae DS-56 TaxID=1116389 RepID=A0A1E5XW92_9HYPH|nr:hypothetical protein [Devosia insulae]OEO32855.1 hypothetical protein VW23_009515 [Devosia insulae DS-56]